MQEYSIIIRKAEPKDFRAIQKIQLEGGDALLTCGEVIDIADMELQSKSDTGLFGVAEVNGEVIGFIYGEKMDGRWAIGHYFAVKKDFRGTDVYQKLGEWFINQARSMDAKFICLYAESGNDKLINFYKRFGFNAGGTYVEMIKEI